MAEESAHQFMEENNPHFSLGVINPFLVLGPHLGVLLFISNWIIENGD